MMNKGKLLLILCASALLLFACVDEDDFKLDRLSETTIRPEVEANIFSMEFTSQDFFDQISDTANGVYLVSQNDELHLNFVKDFTLSGDDLVHDYFNKNVSMHLFDFNFEDIVIPSWYEDTYSDDIVIPDATIDVEIDAFSKYDADEQERVLDSLILAAGRFVFDGKSELPYVVEVHLSSDQVVNTITNENFSQVLTINAKSNINQNVDLKNYKLKLNAKNDNTSTISFKYGIVIKTGGKQVQSGTYALALTLDGKDLDIYLAWGLVGNPVIPIEGVVDVDYFSDSTVRSEMIDIANMSLMLDVTNYTGIQLFLNLDDLKAKTYTGAITKVFEEGKQIIINKSAAPGQTALTKEVLEVDTKSVANLPDQFIYELKSIFGDGHQRGFIYPNDKYLDIHSVLDIPLTVRVNNFVSEKETDALEFLQEEDGVGDYIDSLKLKLDLENSFPAGLTLELFTKDEYGMVTPLISDPVSVASAKVDDNGNVTSPTNAKEEVSISSERYEQLRNADKIIIKATFNTYSSETDKPFVKFTYEDKLKVKLGIKAHTNITF